MVALCEDALGDEDRVQCLGEAAVDGSPGDTARCDLYTRFTREVYRTCMAKVRTNIELEDDYVRAIMDRYGVHTKTEAVDLALRHLAGQPMRREEALSMRGARAIDDAPADASPHGAR